MKNEHELSAPSARRGALAASGNFLRTQWLAAGAGSLLLLLPVWCQRWVQAGDLGSHVYNAWLVHLIRAGKAPGLWIAPQWSNTLFDRMLESTTGRFGFQSGEKVAVSCALLLFFWGSFALCSAAANRAAWRVVPLLLMLAYGWSFSIGFFNMYLSLGLCFLAVALFWRGRGWELLLLAPIYALTTMAHLLGTAATPGLMLFLWLAHWLKPKHVAWLGVASVAAVGAGIVVVSRFAPFTPYRLGEHLVPGGAAQFMTLSNSSVVIGVLYSVLLLVVAGAWLARGSRGEIAAHATLLCLCVTVTLINWILPPEFDSERLGAMGYLPLRISIFPAVVSCALLAVCTVRRWQVVAYALMAATYFGGYAHDAAALNLYQVKLEQAVAKLPPNSRVISAIHPGPARFPQLHALDRACIGRCWLYSDYEIASHQFRIHAVPGNGIVTTNGEDQMEMEYGTYEPPPEEMPLYQVVDRGDGVPVAIALKASPEDQ